MENENNNKENLEKNNTPNINPENEIKSGPKKELLSSSGDVKELGNKNNEILEMMKKKKNKDMTIPIILGVVLLVVVAVVGFLFLNSGEKSKITGVGFQQKILDSSMKAMTDAKTYSFDGDMGISIASEIENLGTSEFVFDIVMAGKADQSDINNPKVEYNTQLDLDISSAGGSQKFSVDFDALAFGQEIAYYKLNDYDLGMMGMMFGEGISEYKGKWYVMNMEELRNMGGAGETGFSDMTMSNMYDIEKIREIYSKYKILKFKKDLGNDKLEGVDVYHYQVELDDKAVVDFYLDILSEKMKNMSGADETNKDFGKAIDDLKKGIEKYEYIINEVVKNINIEVWIGKNDKFMYRTKIDGKFDKEFIEMIEEEMIKNKDLEEKSILGDTKALIEFKMDIKMSDFNELIEIDEPENAENLTEILEEMMMQSMGMTVVDSDQDGLSDKREAYFGTDPNNPDTDGDGFSDGNEVGRGYDPLLPGEAKLDYDKLFSE